MIISVANNLPQASTYTYLTSPTVVGAGTLPVKSLNQFNASWALQVGETGEAQSEIVLLSSSTPQGTIGTTSGTTLYAHPTDTPVYGIKYDQIVFERSTAGTAGTAIPIAGGTVTIMANGTSTIYDDIGGSSSYAYKTYFRNSSLNLTSPESDWITFAGYPMYSLSSIRNRIKNKLFNANYIPNDQIVNDWVNEALEVFTNGAILVNQDYNLGSTQVAFSGTTDLGTITATDFKQDRRVWFSYDGGINQFEASRIPVNEISTVTTHDASDPRFFYVGDNVIGRLPNVTSATACILYYKLNPVLVNDADQLPVSMQGYSKAFVDYGVAQAKRRDNLPQEADSLEQSFASQLNRFKADITPRSQSGPIFARMDESISGSDDSWF